MTGQQPWGKRFASGLSTHPEPPVAVAEVVGAVTDAIGVAPDLAVLMVSGSMADHLADAITAVEQLLRPGTLLATTAVGILGGCEEIEATAAITLWAGTTGELIPLRLETLAGIDQLVAGLPHTIEPGSIVVAWADPYSFAVDALISELDQRHPEVELVGGLASLGQGANQLWLGTKGQAATCHRDGAVGVVLAPGTATAVVSQGCRPVGRPWTVTAGSGQFIETLGGSPALDRLNQMVEELSPRDRLCASQGLHLGMVADEHTVDFARGDFLIRGLLGADRQRGALAVGAEVRVGQTVQFQVRDAESAHEDLVELLESWSSVARPEGGRAQGALVFTCNGRGTHLFAEPNHDAALVSEATNGAVSGMFCAGELGPVGSVNAVHGFTATVLLFP